MQILTEPRSSGERRTINRRAKKKNTNTHRNVSIYGVVLLYKKKSVQNFVLFSETKSFTVHRVRPYDSNARGMISVPEPGSVFQPFVMFHWQTPTKKNRSHSQSAQRIIHQTNFISFCIRIAKVALNYMY